ncbi:MAG: transposase [Prosthecobacter sp.]
MRQPRLKAPADHPTAYYHCVSRIVNRDFVLQRPEREMFSALMRMYEKLCQVRVVTFCVLSNHFHLLVEVPQRPEVMPGEEEVLRIIAGSLGKTTAYLVRVQLQQLREAGAPEAAQRVLNSWTARMWDISAFMKSLKQRFTQWFNKQHGRKGTLWEERYKSTLVEGGGDALAMTAAYIDLNPVRAGLVKDPKDYRWCGYAQAVAGVVMARRGLEVASRAQLQGVRPEQGLIEHYRRLLFTWGQAGKAGGKISREEARKVLSKGGRLPVAEVLRCKVRYFTDGAVLGSRGYVEAIFKAKRGRFGEKRQDGARKMRGLEAPEGKEGLFTLRDLRVRVFGAD